MSDSPQSNPKDVEQGGQSADEEGAQMNDPQDPHSSGLAYEFEVKEQDRWLPIANGMSMPSFPTLMIRLDPHDAEPLPWRRSPPIRQPHIYFVFVHVSRFVIQVARGASRFVLIIQARSK